MSAVLSNVIQVIENVTSKMFTPIDFQSDCDYNRLRLKLESSQKVAHVRRNNWFVYFGTVFITILIVLGMIKNIVGDIRRDMKMDLPTRESMPDLKSIDYLLDTNRFDGLLSFGRGDGIERIEDNIYVLCEMKIALERMNIDISSYRLATEESIDRLLQAYVYSRNGRMNRDEYYLTRDVVGDVRVLIMESTISEKIQRETEEITLMQTIRWIIDYFFGSQEPISIPSEPEIETIHKTVLKIEEKRYEYVNYGVGALKQSFFKRLAKRMGEKMTVALSLFVGPVLDGPFNLFGLIYRSVTEGGDVRFERFFMKDIVFTIPNLLWILTVIVVLPVLSPMYALIDHLIDREIFALYRRGGPGLSDIIGGRYNVFCSLRTTLYRIRKTIIVLTSSLLVWAIYVSVFTALRDGRVMDASVRRINEMMSDVNFGDVFHTIQNSSYIPDLIVGSNSESKSIGSTFDWVINEYLDVTYVQKWSESMARFVTPVMTTEEFAHHAENYWRQIISSGITQFDNVLVISLRLLILSVLPLLSRSTRPEQSSSLKLYVETRYGWASTIKRSIRNLLLVVNALPLIQSVVYDTFEIDVSLDRLSVIILVSLLVLDVIRCARDFVFHGYRLYTLRSIFCMVTIYYLLTLEDFKVLSFPIVGHTNVEEGLISYVFNMADFKTMYMTSRNTI